MREYFHEVTTSQTQLKGSFTYNLLQNIASTSTVSCIKMETTCKWKQTLKVYFNLIDNPIFPLGTHYDITAFHPSVFHITRMLGNGLN